MAKQPRRASSPRAVGCDSNEDRGAEKRPVAAELRPPTSLVSRIQRQLQGLYGLEAPDVAPFVRPSNDVREVLEVRKVRGALELRLHLPHAAFSEEASLSLDVFCQVAEGVSHFLYLAERALRELPATQLELELQAEVDKYLLLSGSLASAPESTPVAPHGRARHVRARLFEDVRFLHAEGTVLGDRYRYANRLAARFAIKLERAFARGVEAGTLKRMLRTFFGAGQREKIEMALAA